MGFLKFLRGGERERKASGLTAPSSAFASGRESAASERPASPALVPTSRKERDKKQRLLGIGRQDELRSIPYASLTPDRHASSPMLSVPVRIHQRTSSIPVQPEPADPALIGSLDFGTPLVQGGLRYSALFGEAEKAVDRGEAVAGARSSHLEPSALPAPPVSAPAPASAPALASASTSELPLPTPDDEKKSFWNIRRRGSKADEEEEPKLRRPSSHVWQFARKRTSSYNDSALDTADAIDDGSFRLKSFRHVSSASVTLEPREPELAAPRPPYSRSTTGSLDEPQPPKVSVAAFRKGIRAQSFTLASDKSALGPDDDLPLSLLAGDGFKRTPPSSYAKEQPPRPKSSTGFVVLSRTASRTDLASVVSPGSQELLMSSEECTSPVEMPRESRQESPVSASRPSVQASRPAFEASPRSARPASEAGPTQTLRMERPLDSPVPRNRVDSRAGSRPTSFFDDPLRLISSFIGRDDEPRIPSPPPRDDEPTIGLDLAGLNLPLPPSAMPDDGPPSRPPLHARLASASAVDKLMSAPVIRPKVSVASLAKKGADAWASSDEDAPAPKAKAKPAFKPRKPRDSSSESDSDEPLATVKQKASMSSFTGVSQPSSRRPSHNLPRPITRPRSSFSPETVKLSPPARSFPTPQETAPLRSRSSFGLDAPAKARSPPTFAPALRGQPSPASSISGKTGDSSLAAAPSTPKDSRRVSFLPGASTDEARNERRREEAKNAVELGNVVNPGNDAYNPYMDPRWAPPMPNYAMMHQQAMAYAKQQYQAAMAAAAMQAANDEWERSSAMTGFSTASTSFFPPYAAYGQHRSEYGDRPMHWGSQSVYGESFGPPGPRSEFGPRNDYGPSRELSPRELGSVAPSLPRSSTTDLTPRRDQKKPNGARVRKAPLLQAYGGIPSAPSSWREIDEREERRS